MLRSEEAKGMLRVLGEMKSTLECGKFFFLRDVCCKMNKGKREVEGSGHEADDEDPDTNSRNLKRSGSCDLVTESNPLTSGQFLGIFGIPKDLEAQMGGRPEPWTPERDQVEGGKIWEWTGYGSEAKHWLLEQANRVKAANGMMEIGRSEGDKVCEWTQYQKEAEREEAKRKGKQQLRDLDFDLQAVGPDSIASMFGGMSLGNIHGP